MESLLSLDHNDNKNEGGELRQRKHTSNPMIEKLIHLYGQVGNYKQAKALFDSIQEPILDASCLCAILYVCSTTTPAQWQDAVQMIHCRYAHCFYCDFALFLKKKCILQLLVCTNLYQSLCS